MTDSACTRGGYDDTGRYHVPVGNCGQACTDDDCEPCELSGLAFCPDCRGHGEHNAECPNVQPEVESAPQAKVEGLHEGLLSFAQGHIDKAHEHVRMAEALIDIADGGEPANCDNLDYDVPMVKVVATDDVNVPLPLQEFYLRETRKHSINVARDMLQSAEVSDLALKRLRDGYPTYRSSMYAASPEQRRQEAMEELADCLNYLSSGPIE